MGIFLILRWGNGFFFGLSEVFASKTPIQGQKGYKIAGDWGGGDVQTALLLNELTTKTTGGTLLAGWDVVAGLESAGSADVGGCKGGGALTEFSSGTDLEDLPVDVASL